MMLAPLLLTLVQDRVILGGENFLIRIENPKGLVSEKIKPNKEGVIARFRNLAGAVYTVYSEPRPKLEKVEAAVDRRLLKLKKDRPGAAVRSKGTRENLFREVANLFEVVAPDKEPVQLAIYTSPKVIFTVEAILPKAEDEESFIQFEQLYLSYAFITDRVRQKGI